MNPIYRVFRKSKNLLKSLGQNVSIRVEAHKAVDVPIVNNRVTVLNTAMHSDNLGDEIIMYFQRKYVIDKLSGCEVREIATHTYPSDDEVNYMLSSAMVVACGTNLLSPQFELYSGWRFDKRLIHMNKLILSGVGWWGYKNPSIYSRYVYRKILDSSFTQSTRDEQTAEKLRISGVNNVFCTNCLTLWGLDDSCSSIPRKKCDCVVFTVTGVYKDVKNDKELIRILKETYEDVFFWPQADEDLDYIHSIDNCDSINILDRTLDAYTDYLESNETDYVGTRLHGGIYAMQHGKRSIIIAVDNRAREMGKDANLPYILSDEISSKLQDMINSNFATSVHLNSDNIKKWLYEFTQRVQTMTEGNRHE